MGSEPRTMEKFRSKSGLNIANSVRRSSLKLLSLWEGRDESRPELGVLAGGISASLEELGLRVTKMGESHKDLRVPVLESRRKITEIRRELERLGSGEGGNPCVFSRIASTSEEILRLSEEFGRQRILEAATPALRTLDILDKSINYKNMFLNIKIFGAKLLSFLEIAALQYHDLRSDARRTRILVRVLGIKRFLPPLIQTLRVYLMARGSEQKRSKDFFFGFVRESIQDIVKTFDSSPTDADTEREKKSGVFVSRVDSLLDLEVVISDDVPKIEEDVEWIIKFALSVAKASSASSNAEIVESSARVLEEFNNLKRALAQNEDQREIGLARDLLKDMIEVLEQSVNAGLLRQIVSVFGELNEPLDDLVSSALSSDVPSNPSHEDLDNEVTRMDDHADALLHVAHFASYCAHKSAPIECSSYVLNELEKELVPAVVRVYLMKGEEESRKNKHYLSDLRRLWISETKRLESAISDVVDPCAFVVVANEIIRSLASDLKKHQFSQDRKYLRRVALKIIKICQISVDLAWREERSSSSSTDKPVEFSGDEGGIRDDHPVVKVERSSWEVSSAFKAVIENVEDLNKHKAFIRRVQLLATSVDLMSNYLSSKNSSSTLKSSDSVRVLTSVSRIVVNESARREVGEEEERRKSMRRGSKILANSTVINNPSRIGERSENYLSKTLESVPNLKHFTLPTRVKEQSGCFSNSLNLTEVIHQLSLSTARPSPGLTRKDSTKKNSSLRQKAIKNNLLIIGSRSPLKTLSNKLNSSSFNLKTNNKLNTSSLLRTPERLKDISNVNRKLDIIKASLK